MPSDSLFLGKSGSSSLNHILYHGTCKVPVHAVLGTCGTGTCGTRYSGMKQVLMADAARLVESVVRYALYPPSTPALSWVVEAMSSCAVVLYRVRRGRGAKDSGAVLEEWGAGKWFGDDVGEVVSGGVFDEEDSFALLGEVDHGVLGSDPFQFGRDALAAGAVDEDAGVGVDGGRSSGCEAKPTEEVSESDYGFCALNQLAQLCSARGVAGIGRQVP